MPDFGAWADVSQRNRHLRFAPGHHCDGDYDRRNDRDMNSAVEGQLILRGMRAKRRCAFQDLF